MILSHPHSLWPHGLCDFHWQKYVWLGLERGMVWGWREDAMGNRTAEDLLTSVPASGFVRSGHQSKIWGSLTASCLKLTLLALEDNQGTDCSAAHYNCQQWGETLSGRLAQAVPTRESYAYIHARQQKIHLLAALLPSGLLSLRAQYFFELGFFPSHKPNIFLPFIWAQSPSHHKPA